MLVAAPADQQNLGNSSKAESSSNLPPPPPSTYPHLPLPAPGDLSQIKDGKVNKSKPCQTLWLTHQKFPQQRSTLCLPSLPTNLAESEGSPLIHASESALNQPLIKREHAEVSSTISSARHPLLESNNTEGKDLFVLRVPSEPPDVWSCCRPFIHPTIANTKQTFSSFSFLTLLPSLSSSSSFCFFSFFSFPPLLLWASPRCPGMN